MCRANGIFAFSMTHVRPGLAPARELSLIKADPSITTPNSAIALVGGGQRLAAYLPTVSS